MTLPDVDDLATLGGVMENYDPVTDPTVELDAGYDNKTRANIAGATQTLDRVFVQFVSAAANPITVQSHNAVWGNTPAVAPTVNRNSAGRYTVTWPTSVTDALGVSHTVGLVGGRGNAQSGAFFQVQFLKSTSNVAEVYIFNAAGGLVDAPGIVIDVWGR